MENEHVHSPPIYGQSINGMGGNIPSGNSLGGNFPGGEDFPGGVWWVGILRVGIFPGGIFLEPWHTYYINLVEVIIRLQKLRQTCRESHTVALSHHVKKRFINVRSNFCRYQVRINKKTVFGCKPSKFHCFL